MIAIRAKISIQVMTSLCATLWLAAPTRAFTTHGSFVIDRTPPKITVSSPEREREFNPQSLIRFAFSATDRSDSVARITAELRGPSGERIAITNEERLRLAAHRHGIWKLVVTAEDAAGNKSEPVEHPFGVSDTLAVEGQDTSSAVVLSLTPSDTTGKIVIPETLLSFAAGNGSRLPRIDWKMDTGEYEPYQQPVRVCDVVGAKGDTGAGFGIHSLRYRIAEGDTEFEREILVSPALSVLKQLSSMPRVLLWWNGARDVEAEAAIQNASVILDTAATAAGFETLLRSNRHNVFVIIGGNEKLFSSTERALAEHVYSGAGIISTNPDLWSVGRDGLENIFATRINGTVRKDFTIEGEDLPVPATLNEVLRADNYSSEVAAWAVPTDTSDVERVPAIWKADFGAGKSILIGFAPSPDLLVSSLNLVRGGEGASINGSLSTTELIVRNLVVPVELAVSIDDLLPKELEVIRFIGPGQSSGDAVTWSLALDAGSESTVGYVVRLPNEKADLRTEAEVRYLVGGKYRLFGRFPLEVNVSDIEDDFDAALDRIDKMQDGVSTQDQNRLDQAKRNLESIRDDLRRPRIDKEAAIGGVIHVIQSLLETEAVDNQMLDDLRLRLDAIMRKVEVRS